MSRSRSKLGKMGKGSEWSSRQRQGTHTHTHRTRTVRDRRDDVINLSSITSGPRQDATHPDRDFDPLSGERPNFGDPYWIWIGCRGSAVSCAVNCTVMLSGCLLHSTIGLGLARFCVRNGMGFGGKIGERFGITGERFCWEGEHCKPWQMRHTSW